MTLSLGIVGLPNVGKSTFFNALTNVAANVSNYPFCTIDPNVAVVPVPDIRLEEVQKFMQSPKAVPATIEFHDIAGLVKNAHKGEGLGNQFLAHIRKVDAILHVVRCFSDSNIVHVDGTVDPVRDIEVINLELILSDLNAVEKKLATARSASKTGDKKKVKEQEFYEKLKAHLEKGSSARTFPFHQDEEAWLSGLFLLSVKPVLYLANVSENPEAELISKVEKLTEKEKAGLLAISAQLEFDLKSLSVEEKEEYLKDLGQRETAPGLNQLIRASYKLLNLITFFTANQKEAHAWTTCQDEGMKRAAGCIHTDFEKGFISAEVLHYPDLEKCHNHAEAKEKGILHLEGKQSKVVDGDLIYFHFNL